MELIWRSHPFEGFCFMRQLILEPHMSTLRGSLEGLIACFGNFVEDTPFGGSLEAGCSTLEPLYFLH
jgi:hypothetical protein